MTISNATFKGVSLFLHELRKHLKSKTAGKFWRELSGRTGMQLNYTYNGVDYPSLYQLVEWVRENNDNLDDKSFNDFVSDLTQTHWMLDRKCFFMLEIVDEQDAEENVDTTVDSTSVDNEATVESDTTDIVSKEDEKQVAQTEANEETSTDVAEKATNVANLDAMNLDELKAYADKIGHKYHPKIGEKKLRDALR